MRHSNPRAVVGGLCGLAVAILLLMLPISTETVTFNVRSGHCQTGVLSRDVFGIVLSSVEVCG